ncbi:MAG: efflux transporter outer membrane subunit [Marinifilaceae bacterium]
MKKSIINIALFAFIALSLGGCKAGKNFVNRKHDLNEVIEKSDTIVKVGEWWKLYDDPTLSNYIATAIDNNKDMLIALANINELQALYRVEKSNLYPKIDAKATYDLKKGGAEYGQTDGLLKLSWDIDIWGKNRWAKDGSKAQYLGSVEAAKGVQITVVAEVVQNYLELQTLKEELSIVRQTLKAREEAIKLAKLRYEGGLTSETAYKQAQVEHARTATLVPQLEKDIQFKENSLAILVGKRPQEEMEIDNNKLFLDFAIPANLSSALIMGRPDMLVAEQNLRSAQSKVGVAFTSLFPTFSITGSLGSESSSLKEFIQSPHWAIGGAALMPLINMGQNRAKLKASEAAYEKEVLRYQKSVLMALQEVSNAITDANKTIEIVTLRRNLEKEAAAYLKCAELQYINGVISYMDVLDAQRGYFDAQIALTKAVRDREVAVVKLYKSLGGGLG